MVELFKQRLIVGAIVLLAAASVWNALNPARPRYLKDFDERAVGEQAGDDEEAYAAQRQLGRALADERRVRGVVELRVLKAASRGPEGWSFDAVLERLDGRAPSPPDLRVRLFVPTEFSEFDANHARRAPALPGDKIEVFGRLSPYSGREFPGVRAQAERMAAQGIDARALALEAVEVKPEAYLKVGAPITRIKRVLARAQAGFEGRVLSGMRFERAALWGEREGDEALWAPAVSQHAALTLALTTANRRFLAPETSEPFRRTATSHLLAISGLHLGVLAALIWWICGLAVNRAPRLLRRYGRRRVCGAAVIVVLGAYVLMIGAPVSAVRAWVGLTIGVFSLLFLRPLCPFHALAAAAIALLMWEPATVVDLGFQLSFSATLGILLFLRFRPAPLQPQVDLFEDKAIWGKKTLFRRVFSADRLRAVGLFVGVSTSATIATMPALAAHFGEVALCGLWVNLVVTPFVSALLFPLLVLGAGASLVWQAGGLSLVWICCETLLAMGPWMAELASWPGAQWVGGVAPGWAVVAMSLGALVWAASRWRPQYLLVGLALFIGGFSFGWIDDLWVKEAELKVHFIPVGQGDSILVEFPDRRTLLVDAGGTSWGQDPGYFVVVPYLRRLGISRLDMVLATHAHTDHVGGLGAVVEAMRPREFLAGYIPEEDGERGRKARSSPGESGHFSGLSEPSMMSDLLARARQSGARVRRVDAQGWARSFGGAKVEVTAPQLPAYQLRQNLNESSLVTRVVYQGASILLTGDIERAAEAWVVGNHPGRATVLKAAHHGSKTSSHPEFLDVTQPKIAVISAGRFNRFGHPHPRVVARYRRRGIKIWETAFQGLIRVHIQAGGRMEVRAARPSR